MINNARGSHVSPGVYMKEEEMTYAVKSLGLTTLGLVGETVKGPAFQPIAIKDWNEFVSYFGGTSALKFPGKDALKFELPHVAKAYLKESKQLEVCRVLGISGYDAGAAYVVTADNKVVCVLRSKASHKVATGEGDPCSDPTDDNAKFVVTSVKKGNYTGKSITNDCKGYKVSTGESVAWKFNIDVISKVGEKEKETTKTVSIPVSLDPKDNDYIAKVIGTDPNSGNLDIFIESFYENAISLTEGKDEDGKGDGIFTPTIAAVGIETVESAMNDYKGEFKPAVTPWILSEVKDGGDRLDVKRLFRIYTISDGDVANEEIKISFQNIRPEEGTFDILVRDFYDTDKDPVILEKFTRCTMNPGSPRYIANMIGTVDGVFELKSNRIMVEMAPGSELGESVPCGFEGYAMPKISGVTYALAYNTKVDLFKPARRQFFGLSDIKGIDKDYFTFKGNLKAENTDQTKGFHLDERITVAATKGEENIKVYIDSVDASGKLESINTIRLKKGLGTIATENAMKGSIYEDVKMRKFTVCPAGGFDAWDIYYTERTNTDSFRANKYVGSNYKVAEPAENLNRMITFDGPFNYSDYYAYLGAINTFNNPEEVDINLFATPGINWLDNMLLTKDTIEMIEDFEFGRGGDALYVMASPNVSDPDEVVDDFKETEINSSYAVTYWPWVKCYDAPNGVYVNVPVTKDVVKNMAYTDNNFYPWFAPAGITRGDVDCVRACYSTRLQEEDSLYDNGINAVKTFAADGVKIWGNKTTYNVDSPLDRINVRRLMIRVKKLISTACRALVFEPNDTTVRNQFLAIVNPILEDVRSNRGITDYRIKIDNSPEAIDAHVLPAKIWIKPTMSLEYIDITFVITPNGASFED